MRDRLDASKQRLEHGTVQLEGQRDSLRKHVTSVDEQTAALAAWLEAQQEADDGKVGEEVIRPADPLSDQLYEQTAESNAIDDALYELERAFGSENIEVDAFLKTVRKLSNKQFMAKALAKKVRIVGSSVKHLGTNQGTWAHARGGSGRACWVETGRARVGSYCV